jgi:hypothetical protein
MCDCWEKIIASLTKEVGLKYPKMIDYDLCSGKTYSMIDYAVTALGREKKDKKGIRPLYHIYCPWCGEKYADEEE